MKQVVRLSLRGHKHFLLKHLFSVEDNKDAELFVL